MSINTQNVEAIARAIYTAQSEAATGRTSYLRALIASSQAELGAKGKPVLEQLAALRAVHEAFYEVVLRAAEDVVPRGTKQRSVELHRRANFARTALSAIRSHVRAGADLMLIKSATVTKASLKVHHGPPRMASGRRLKLKVERTSKILMSAIMGLTDTDKEAAVAEIQLLLGQLGTQLVSMGLVSTKDAVQASQEHRPLRIGKTLFMPTETQVLAAQARPS